MSWTVPADLESHVSEVGSTLVQKGYQTATAYGGRDSNDLCMRVDPSGRLRAAGLTGAGTRVIPPAASGVPQLLDLSTGRTGWRATVRGTALDSTAQAVLIRQVGIRGRLSVLDLATGSLRWTVPDPRLRQPGWTATITEQLVVIAVANNRQRQVIVYDVDNGRRLGVASGQLAGAGSDWVAVTRLDEQVQQKLDLIRF